MSKKVLILSGSPRKAGNSEILCDKFAKGAGEAGHHVETISVRGKNLGFCTACDGCQQNPGKCVLEDDMTEILAKMVEADVIVMATPVYFYSIDAQMKVVIDRTYARYMELRDKEFYFIMTAADKGKEALGRTLGCFRGFTDCLPGAKEKGVVYGTGAWAKGEIRSSDAMQQAYDYGKQISSNGGRIMESGLRIRTSKNEKAAAVYMTKDISAEGLMAIYNTLGRQASGKVAVKISSGEPGGNHFLSVGLIGPLVRAVKGTIVECNTAYGGKRADTDSHRKVVADHGFTSIAPVDLMDAEGSIGIPIAGGKHLKETMVGASFPDYDFVVNLAHFKGHAMGGFGGVVKNMSIGIASAMGKSLIHTAGKATVGYGPDTPQDDFLESMAEAAKGVADYMGGDIVYINVMNNLSVDCDCDSNPAKPEMEDIGILASLDPIALDQACVDLVYAAPDGKALIERMETRHAIHTLEHAEAIGFGTRNYDLYLV